MKKYKNKKFIFERSNFVHLLNFRRIRIPENRDLKKGLRLNRNERVENFPKFFLKKYIKRKYSMYLPNRTYFSLRNVLV